MVPLISKVGMEVMVKRLLTRVITTRIPTRARISTIKSSKVVMAVTVAMEVTEVMEVMVEEEVVEAEEVVEEAAVVIKLVQLLSSSSLYHIQERPAYGL